MPRGVPLPLLNHFGSSARTLADCWAVKPTVGAWEGYTSHDRDLVLGAFNDTPSAPPALTYLNAGGVSPTSVTTRLNLSKSGIDISVLAFDREKLLSGYYGDAVFEAFVLNYEAPEMGRDVIVSGRIGNIEVGPVSATFELVPWPAFAEQAFGRLLTTHCCVKVWGTAACRNRTLQDGPLRVDWSAAAIVDVANSAHQLTLVVSDETKSGAPLNEAFFERLENGDVEFSGGRNEGAARSVKTAVVTEPGTVEVVLHEDLPFIPESGDALWLVAGCKRDRANCEVWNNFLNYQGNPDRVTASALVNRGDE